MTTAAEEDWMEKARRLQVGDFMQVCNRVFMQDMPRNSYLMSDFAHDVTDFCAQFATQKSSCPNSGFRGLQLDFQDAFFRSASQQMGIPMNRFPVGALTSIGDTGYIFSQKTKPELDSMRNDLCIQMQTAFGGSMQIPKQIEEPSSPIAPTAQTDSPTDSPVAAPTGNPTTIPRTPRPTNPSPKHSVTDLGGDQEQSIAQQQKEFDSPQIPIVQGDTSLSVGAIVGIAIAVAVVLSCFFYFEARRRNLARQIGILAAATNNNNDFSKSKPSVEVDTAKPPIVKKRSQKSSSRSSAGPSRSTSATLDEIRNAVNKADWDNIYRLASQLAEEDDAQSLPGFTLPKENRRRSHLNAEDRERTKTLDDLMARGDWTGVAVTAALYAGESGSSHEPTRDQPIGASKKTRKSLHHDEDDWKQVHIVSLDEKSNSSHPSSLSDGSVHSRDIEQGRVSLDGLVQSLNEALNAGDWAQVNYFATRIKEEKGTSGGSSMVPDDISNPQTLLLANGSSRVASNLSAATTDTDVSRKQTIEKLMRAEKWKGVSIMANLYEMESKQQAKSPVARASQTSKRPPRSVKKPTGSRTKELRHSDRVDENIAGFRQEEDALVPSYGNR
ncbi:hypothetical protein IV203_013548 [Nitzschia inconspicua]|uniref:Uncharacterized protein n=1 Tax=Nitzschia inconspicua TaxID=303405 RepID=A0A9K3M5C3_9STRA|nr:hypothetical protein IV203_013548 [Nitzschia inconspicua]